VSSDIVIDVENVSKAYAIWTSPAARLHGPLLGRVGQLPFLPAGTRNLCKRLSRESFRNFYALKNISFQVRRGESFGIIGRNGSGKSTLLQIIAGTLMPTEGETRLGGKVAALLELGSGFNPEFTGRENVYMNATVLGLSRHQIDLKFDEIADFADIGEFIDQPVKTYSSGMLMRLAFAVTTRVDAEVVVIDEALAVGDMFFRQKCYQHLESLRAKGVSIVLVSHGMADVEQFCQRAVLLHHGELVFQGSGSEAVKRYYLVEQEEYAQSIAASTPLPRSPTARTVASDDEIEWPTPEAFLNLSRVSQVSNGCARCTGVAICDAEGRPCAAFQQGETATFYCEFELERDIDAPLAGVEIINDKGIIVHGRTTLEYGVPVPCGVSRGSRLRLKQDITLELALGEYTFTVGLGMLAQRDYEMADRFPHVELHSKIVRLCVVPKVGQFCIIFRRAGKPVQLLHHGLANLPGSAHLVAREGSRASAPIETAVVLETHDRAHV